MAEAEDIESVRDALPSDSDWTDAKIEEELDEGKTVDQVIYAFWSKRAADTYTMVNVTESGSSRTLSDIHRNAVAMAKMYQDRIDREDTSTTTRRGRRSIVLRRT